MREEPSWLHELRGSVAAIRVWCDVLRLSDDEQQRERALDRIAASAELLEKQLDDRISAEPNGDPGPARPAATGQAIVRLDGISVLVVDDDANMRAALTALLGQLGAQVVTVESGEAARREIARARPDVMICDLNLPGEDGLAVLQSVHGRSNGPLSPIPAIALTGAQALGDLEATRAAGFDLHLVKPPKLVELTSALAALARRG